MSVLKVENDGRAITATNYWELGGDRFLFSVNAGAVRLLVPRSRTAEIRQVVEDGIKVAVLSIGLDKRYGYERAHLMMEDGSNSPYCIESGLSAFDLEPDRSWYGREGLEFLAYTCGDGAPKLAWRGRLVVRHTKCPDYTAVN